MTFSSPCWRTFDALGDTPLDEPAAEQMPAISLDLWLQVEESDLHLVLPLLPSLAWQGAEVGIRIEFAARDAEELLRRFREERAEARVQAAGIAEQQNDSYAPWPKSLTDYLKNELSQEFTFQYYVLDRVQFDADYRESPDYRPFLLGNEPGGAAILKSLVRVDALGAQRHLADPSASIGATSGRSEDLSRRLSRFYKRNLEQRKEDHQALRALFNSEAALNKHLEEVFRTTLDQLSSLGYPGLHNPRLEIRSALNPAAIMSSQDARVHYVLGDGADSLPLPDSYNGLGYKNLIYMVVEILDMHAAWKTDENRPPLHLVFIEEPEAHLHAQLQQVFVRKVLELMEDAEEGSAFRSQAIVTTHSPHIVYERGFKPIRYFRRRGSSDTQTSEVLNLSAYYDANSQDRDFLQRYLKLTHCDLFFADAVILVEGNVERLLLPVMIDKAAASLQSVCLCILEVGGAFAHRFESLIRFLGLTALIITDLDSVASVEGVTAEDDDDIVIPEPTDDQAVAPKRGRSCLPLRGEGVVTSNQTLIQWIPRMATIDQLFAATPTQKIQEGTGGASHKVGVAYQTPIAVSWNGETESVCGRTLEVAFGLENAALTQRTDKKHLGLKLRRSPATPTELAAALHNRVSAKSFDKTTFALGVLTEPLEQWQVPSYIKEGLEWLSETVRLESPHAVPLAELAESVDSIEVEVVN